MKTLADLKRDAKSGKISGEMIVRFGDTDIPDKLKGVRKIVDANTVGIKFLNADGKTSELQIKCASLVEYDENSLTIFNAGFREFNDEELRVMAEWKLIEDTEEFQRREINDVLSDGSGTYYQKKYFFEDKGFGYLCGFNEERGLKYDFNTKLIRDNKIKGDVELKYNITRN